MKKNILSIALAVILVFSFLNTALALELTEIDLSVLGCDTSRGTVIEIPGLTFKSMLDSDTGIDSSRTTVKVTYKSLSNSGLSSDPGCYSLTPETGRFLISKNSFNLKPNRNYLISTLINCEYDRSSCEVSMGFNEYDEDGQSVLTNYIGAPAVTNGWYRFEGIVTTSSRTAKGKFSLSLYGFNIPDEENEFYISDLNILELPEEELEATQPGAGMVFGGSSGMYDMRVRDVVSTSDVITVTTTGAEYIFDKNADTVTAYQLINGKRHLFTAGFNKSLANLTLKSKSNNEAVLTTGEGGLTIGVQMDSLMLISNHGNEDLDIVCESAIAGKWNRLSQGNLMAKDDTGGFTINPYIPMGTGRLARYNAGSGVDFDGVVNDTSFISSAAPGWIVDYTISDGELLGMSVFPAREFDWTGSFDNTYINYFRGGSTAHFQQDADLYGVDVAVLWNFTQRAWGMSFGNEYVPINENTYKNNISSAHKAGIKAAPYMSMYYWHNRDIDEYIGEVKRHRDVYGIDGIYSDGLPDKEWLAAYEGVRKLRELFPYGVLIFHTTGQDGNGGPPLAVPDISIPAIDAYSTMTLRGEGVSGDGVDWEYPKNITSGYNTSNSIGIMKGDAWTEGEEVIPQEKQNLINLLYNGRARVEERTSYMEEYNSILRRLEINHIFLGDNQDYYNNGYLPYVHRMIRDKVDFEGEQALSCGFDYSDELSAWEQEGIGSFSIAEIDGEGTLCICDDTRSESGRVFYEFGEHIGLLNISFDVMVDSTAGGEMYITDNMGRKLLGIYAIDGELRYYGRIGGYRKIADCIPEQRLNISIQADSTTKRFDVYVDGELVVDGAYFTFGTGFPSRIYLGSSDCASGNVYYDDVEINLNF